MVEGVFLVLGEMDVGWRGWIKDTYLELGYDVDEDVGELGHVGLMS